MPDSDVESTDGPSPEQPKRKLEAVWSEELGRFLPPVETRFKPGEVNNPHGRGAGKWSLLENLRFRLAKDPNPSGFGRLNDALVDGYLNALERLQSCHDEEEAGALQVFLQGFIALMNRVDPPKSKIEGDARKRMVLLMGKPGERANLVDFVAEQRKLLAERTQKQGLNGAGNGHIAAG